MQNSYAGAVSKLVSYRTDAPLFPAAPLGWLLHRAQTNGSLFNYFNGLTSPNRKFSHAWVSKDGKVEQYQTLDRQSWAQAGGNDLYLSVETEGYATEPLTPAQIRSLALFHVATGTTDMIVNTKGRRGIGVHNMVTPTACPGPVASGQRRDILAEVERLRGQVAPKPVNKPPYPGAMRTGSKGAPVMTLQRRLNVYGARLVIDGDYGRLTRNAVINYQNTRHLVADGIVGPATWAALW